MLREFSLAELVRLDEGRIVTAWDQAVGRAAEDCKDRPGEIKPRKVCLILELSPVTQQGDNVLDSVNGAFQITESIPARKTNPYNLAVHHHADGPRLLFNDLSEDDVHQMTIDQ